MNSGTCKPCSSRGAAQALGAMICLALIGAVLSGQCANAQPADQESAPREGTAQGASASLYQYAVKLVCGRGDGQILAKGHYFTAVNVLNPSQDAVGFIKRFAIALPSETAGPVSQFFDARLGPHEALEIDNGDIFRHLRSDAPFLKGFVIIQSKVELDIVAVYTAAGDDGQVVSFHCERVPPRRVAAAAEKLQDGAKQ